MITTIAQVLFVALVLLTLLALARGKFEGMLIWLLLAAFVFPTGFMDAFDGSIHIELGSMAVGFGVPVMLFVVYALVRNDAAKRRLRA